MESEKYSHYIFVVFIVFLAGFLAEIGGIEPIIGAFAAGLALNKLIPHSSALMNRIEFIGNALFIPIFLISVGMLVNISVIFEGYKSNSNSCCVINSCTFGEVVGSLFTQKSFKYSIHNAILYLVLARRMLLLHLQLFL